MKYLILNPVDKRIMHISTTISYMKNRGCIIDTGLRIAPNIFEVVAVINVPEDVCKNKYFFIDNDFILDETYLEKEIAYIDDTEKDDLNIETEGK